MHGHDRRMEPMLGYLNLSSGKPDPRFRRQLGEQLHRFVSLDDQAASPPWAALGDGLRQALAALRQDGAAAFRDTAQAERVIDMALGSVLAAYRRHHGDLLSHLKDENLFQPFFLAQVFEAVLAEGPPWEEKRILPAVLRRLNDFTGYRPVAVLEGRRRGQPHEQEKVCPVSLYLQGAGVSHGPYQELLRLALAILGIDHEEARCPLTGDADLILESGFQPQHLEDLAFDPRGYDFTHPANRRPNHGYGEWDPHRVNRQGHWTRYVVRPMILDALLERANQEGPGTREERLLEAAAVLAGTMLMVTGLCGQGPAAHDSETTIGKLLPLVARIRDQFYERLIDQLQGSHRQRLREERERTRQPFGGARQHLNDYLARQRASQVQDRALAVVLARMGLPDQSQARADRIAAASGRFVAGIWSRLTLIDRYVRGGRPLAEASLLLAEAEDLLRRGIHCGALADPWNILGFQGQFPLGPAIADSVRDPRIDELLAMMERVFASHARLLAETGARGDQEASRVLLEQMRRTAAWWDRFASTTVSGVLHVHGGEAVRSAAHVSSALSDWQARGGTEADLAFWRGRLEGFQAPRAFALVIEELLERRDLKAAMGLLVAWLGSADHVRLADGEHSFGGLAPKWLAAVLKTADPWPLVRRFLDLVQANAGPLAEVPELEGQKLGASGQETNEENPFEAAYEGVTFRDSAEDGIEGSIADDGAASTGFSLEREAESLAIRLTFLRDLASLQQHSAAARPGQQGEETLAHWIQEARARHQRLQVLLDALLAAPVPAPLGTDDSIMEYERRLGTKFHLLELSIAASLETAAAAAALEVLLPEPPAPNDWLARAARVAAGKEPLESWIAEFQKEPLLYVPLEAGGEPRAILRARTSQAALAALLRRLPARGRITENYHLLRLARRMEQAAPAGGRRVTEFDRLFRLGLREVIRELLLSAKSWPGGEPPSDLLETAVEPYLKLWVEHGRSLRLSPLEDLRDAKDWSRLRAFVQRYGGDLFQPRFMTLANLRGILHHGVANYLDNLRDQADPQQPIRLIDDLGAAIQRDQAARHLECILEAVALNYEEYKDYNSSTAHSDYGQNLHVLLDFLRIKSVYDRQAWSLVPLYLAHEELLHQGLFALAAKWESGVAAAVAQSASLIERDLGQLEARHGIRLRTVRQRIESRFVGQLRLDRLRALVRPVLEEVAAGPPGPAWEKLRLEIDSWLQMPEGSGLDLPEWLQALETEIGRVEAAETSTEDSSNAEDRILLSRAEIESWITRQREEGA